MTSPSPGSTHGDRRADCSTSVTIASALRLSRAKGRVQAWHYLRDCSVPAQTALRVLSTEGARRSSDVRPSCHAVTVPGTNAAGSAQRSMLVHGPSDEVFSLGRRVNQATEMVCERAVAALLTESRAYAESLLRMYNLKTSTIMRVLNHPELRRKHVGTGVDSP